MGEAKRRREAGAMPESAVLPYPEALQLVAAAEEHVLALRVELGQAERVARLARKSLEIARGATPVAEAANASASVKP